ncbi:hypothetical protein [Borreliella tanukii]
MDLYKVDYAEKYGEKASNSLKNLILEIKYLQLNKY